jgi:multicomponent Na+:H+ antiporter subunit D
MTSGIAFWLPLALLGTSLVPGVLIFFLREEAVHLRSALNLTAAALKLVLTGYIFWASFRGAEFETRLPFLPELDLVLRVDFLALLFVSLSAILWFVTTIFAVGYLENSPHRSRFFGFFSLCVTATMGIALAGNLLTFFVFYELLSIVTYPLVVHRGTGKALAAGRTYLLYTLSGGTLLLFGMVWLHGLAGPIEFMPGGVLSGSPESWWPALVIIFALLIAGLGVKAALFPLHGWLPEAMVAPAPVSALLHAVAVVKAGAFGIVRVIYDVYGLSFADLLGVLFPVAVLASFTIVYGSVLALRQTELKKLLAYSTISQLSYIALGAAVFGPLATMGGLVHLLHQGIMKITLFFCAGVLAETLHIHKIRDMAGLGRRMPVTMVVFTITAFGMIGVPPTAGFISKWYLGLGGIEAGQEWVVMVLVASSVLNAAYFLPILHTAWFREPTGAWADEGRRGWLEAHWMLLVPAVVTGVLSIAAGIVAGMTLSPLGLARLAVEGIYIP